MLLLRYDVRMTNRLRSSPTYTGRLPTGTSCGGLDQQSSSQSELASTTLSYPPDRSELPLDRENSEDAKLNPLLEPLNEVWISFRDMCNSFFKNWFSFFDFVIINSHNNHFAQPLHLQTKKPALLRILQQLTSKSCLYIPPKCPLQLYIAEAVCMSSQRDAHSPDDCSKAQSLGNESQKLVQLLHN